jgi:hypothetical protein
LRPPAPGARSRPMAAILTILGFVAVIVGLNWYEFGRID